MSSQCMQEPGIIPESKPNHIKRVRMMSAFAWHERCSNAHFTWVSAVLERACVKAASALDHGKDLLDAVCAAISVLEVRHELFLTYLEAL